MANATKDYEVLQNLRHDGRGYKIGSLVPLSDKDAKTLLDRKVVGVPAPKEKAAK